MSCFGFHDEVSTVLEGTGKQVDVLCQVAEDMHTLLVSDLFESACILFEFVKKRVDAVKAVSPERVYPKTLFLVLHMEVMYFDALFALQEWKRGISLLEQVIECITLLPDGVSSLLLPKVLLKLSKCYEKMSEPISMGRSRESSESLKRSLSALQEIPYEHRSVNVWLRMGKLYHLLGKKKAIECFRNVIRMNPLAIEAQLVLIQLVNTIEPASIDRYKWYQPLLQVHLHLHHHRYLKAQTELAGLFTVDPQNPQLLLLSSQIYLQKGQLELSKSQFKSLLSVSPHSIVFMDIYAWVLRSQCETAVLRDLCHSLLQWHEGRPETWIAMSLYCDLEGEVEKALEYAELAIDLNKRNVSAWLVKGFLCLSRSEEEGDFVEEAVEAYRKAFELDGNSIAALQGLVESYLAGKQLKEALTVTKSVYALKRFKSNAKVEILLGTVLSHSEKPELLQSAQALFKNALARFRKEGMVSMQALLGLVQLLCDKSLFKEALGELKRALLETCLSEADRMVLHHRIGQLYAKEQQFNEASDHFHAVLAIAPEGEHGPTTLALDELERVREEFYQ